MTGFIPIRVAYEVRGESSPAVELLDQRGRSETPHRILMIRLRLFHFTFLSMSKANNIKKNTSNFAHVTFGHIEPTSVSG